MPEPLKLFISYRSSDAPKVDKIARDLALLKHEDGTPRYAPWQDKHNLPPASPHWWDAIVEAIEASKVFVLHISQESLKSVVCQAELDYAHRRNRPIIPVVLDGEFFLDDRSGKYNLPKETWDLIPPWLGERQFLFYTGTDFFRQFEMAMDVFRRDWPRDLYAPRPMDPTPNTNQTRNYALYDQACDYAERLAFAEAEKLFDVLVRRNDRLYGSISAEWLEIIRRYAELIEVDSLARSRVAFKRLWEEYIALFPKDFIDGLFDPKGYANRGSEMPPAHPVEQSLTPVKWMATEEASLELLLPFLPIPPTSIKSKKTEEQEQPIEKQEKRGWFGRVLGAVQAEWHFINAIGYYHRGEYDQAIAAYTECIRHDPQYADAYNNRGNSYKARGDRDRAITDYTEAIRLKPQNAGAYYNRGMCYDNKGDLNRAIEDYTEAIRLNPQYANAYNNRGVSYHNKGDYDRAIADYDTALQIDPNHPHAANSRKRAVEARKKQGQ